MIKFFMARKNLSPEYFEYDDTFALYSFRK